MKVNGYEIKDLADLLGANLREADLCEANLRGADLCEADLRGADLCEADLRGASLREADLLGANLRGANLRGANLREANLCWANLREADLCWANLCGADLCEADLYGAELLCFGNMEEVKTLQIDTWSVGYTYDTLQIGCESHPIDKWRKWDTQAGRKWVDSMNGSALEWADKHLDIILKIIEVSPAQPTGKEP